jgi:hypothetical protein
LAPQWNADLDYIEELAAKLTPSLSLEEQLNFALSEGTIHQPIIAGNQVLFTSARRDLHADPIPTIRQIAEGEFEIVVRAVSRPNYVQVGKIGNRLVLTNGVHKVCALHKAGFSHCYCLVRDVDHIRVTGINIQSTMFRDPVFKSVRPAMVVDFLNAATAAALYIRSMYQILQITINAGTMTIPALPKEPSKVWDQLRIGMCFREECLVLLVVPMIKTNFPTIVNEAIKPFQPQGLMGERDIHRRPFEVCNIPLFDAANELHLKIDFRDIRTAILRSAVPQVIVRI